MNEALSASCFDRRIFPFSESVFSFQNDTITKKGALLFFFFAFFQTENVFCAMMFFNMYTAKTQLLEGETEAVGNVMLCQIKNY